MFGRAAARDFVDVFSLRVRFDRRDLEGFAVAKDRGFTLDVLSDAFGVLRSLPRSSFEVDDAQFASMTAEFADRRADLAKRDRQ